MPRFDGRMGGWADGRSWNLIVDPVGRSGEYNMAADEALLDDVVKSGGAFLRLYRWDPPTLSIGRNQGPDGIVHQGIPWVRRPTGGTAVWHEHELTYAVAAPIALFGSLRNAYCEIHTRLATALRVLGVDAVIAPTPANRPSARPIACFAAAVGGEILFAGRKLVGSAQVRRGQAFLQHGSILLASSQQKVTAVTQETSIAAALGRIVTFEEITTAIVENWSESFEPSERQTARLSAVASLAAR